MPEEGEKQERPERPAAVPRRCFEAQRLGQGADPRSPLGPPLMLSPVALPGPVTVDGISGPVPFSRPLGSRRTIRRGRIARQRPYPQVRRRVTVHVHSLAELSTRSPHVAIATCVGHNEAPRRCHQRSAGPAMSSQRASPGDRPSRRERTLAPPLGRLEAVYPRTSGPFIHRIGEVIHQPRAPAHGERAPWLPLVNRGRTAVGPRPG